MKPDRLVERLFDAVPDNPPGPFYVIRDQCVACGLPPECAPSNITWHGCDACSNHCRVERQPKTESELDQVIESALGSCIEAIRYCGTDPEILQRFREADLERLCDVLCER